MKNRLSYSSQTPIFPEFCSLLLASYFSEKNCWQNRCSPTCVVTGCGDKETGAITAQRQQDIIKQFAEGAFNLLISTVALVQEINVLACNIIIM